MTVLLDVVAVLVMFGASWLVMLSEETQEWCRRIGRSTDGSGCLMAALIGIWGAAAAWLVWS